MDKEETAMVKPVKKKRDATPIYARIALDIANRIVNEELQEGRKLSGRSLMSSEYGVSPETIRRAFSLLEEQQVVAVYQNSGVRVVSKANAQHYIALHGNRDQTRELLAKMHELIESHERIGQELFSIVKTLVDSTERFAASNPFFTYECTIDPTSFLVDKTLGEVKFWQHTGATVIAIRRAGSILLSPGPKMKLEAEDTLVLVGAQQTRDIVVSFVSIGPGNSALYIQ
ncbi:MAG: TrkA C-terminal domain-containing protein [Sphaerochaetaceae bacterium]|jgi:K+/H+ antiporter YhaU regulatory subunit KhtT|nr:GntR family transcriptional regulator [Sphaerochaetaceae bacterium]MDD3670857.1 TrkA C-terminal domain-containing protein [Sphaerochaetaceae bacterium]MDD4259680.1 TrkA C-terminal domain-containing protein [Sphaerochaetaceae bacterium]MDD4840734.1 TrkA C-terminal domain-containing protein [Sphaerochaetaceae bacterium]